MTLDEFIAMLTEIRDRRGVGGNTPVCIVSGEDVRPLDNDDVAVGPNWGHNGKDAPVYVILG